MKTQEKYAVAIRRLWSGSAYVSRQLDSSLGAIHGIGLTEYMVLQHLANAPNNALRRIDLAHALGRTASGITRMLRPMEKIGLVEKDVSVRDARVSLVRLTASGERVYDESSATVNQQSQTLLKGLDSRKLDEFLSLLDAVPGA
jgi:DNA-binding MarR family transcriptional regulator